MLIFLTDLVESLIFYTKDTEVGYLATPLDVDTPLSSISNITVPVGFSSAPFSLFFIDQVCFDGVYYNGVFIWFVNLTYLIIGCCQFGLRYKKIFVCRSCMRFINLLTTQTKLVKFLFL